MPTIEQLKELTLDETSTGADFDCLVVHALRNWDSIIKVLEAAKEIPMPIKDYGQLEMYVHGFDEWKDLRSALEELESK